MKKQTPTPSRLIHLPFFMVYLMCSFHATAGDISPDISSDIAVSVSLSHETMKMRVGNPALIDQGGLYPALTITSGAAGEVRVEVEITREGDKQIIGNTSGMIAPGQHLTLLENTPAPPPGIYRMELTYQEGSTVRYDAYFFTVGLDALRAHLPRNGSFSEIVFPGPDGKLVYIPDYRGNRIPDFSRVGYRSGEAPIPDVPVRVTLSPEPGDNLARIQAAIDQVSALEPDQSGFRGAVLLRRGVYVIQGDLTIKTSGVVLRGEGSGDDKSEMWLDPDKEFSLEDFETYAASKSATVLIRPAHASRGVLQAQGGGITAELDTATEILDHYVPVGAVTFHVENPGAFQVGDRVMVRRRGNPEWITEIGMDQLPDTAPWTGDNFFEYDFERNLLSVDGNRITIDSPIMTAIETRWGGGAMFKCDASARLNRVGMEGMRLVLFDNPREGMLTHMRGIAVLINNVEDGWVRDIVAENFHDLVFTLTGARRFTVRDSSVLMAPGRFFSGYVPRYGFYPTGASNHVLFTGCHATNNRHAYAVYAWVKGPNVFHNSVGQDSLTYSEPHHRWSSGGLYDNVNDKIALMNRGTSGSGHGWAGANYVAWNTSGTLIAQQPPTAQNWAIGHTGERGRSRFHRWNLEKFGFSYGHWESQNTPVTPQSLYLRQLEDRLKPKN